MNRIKTSSFFSVLCLLALGMTGCGTSSSLSSDSGSGNSSVGDSSIADDDGDYDLVYRSWDTGTLKQNNPERQLVKAFEQANNVKIKIVENVGSGDDYWINIRASVTKNTAADVFMTPNIYYPLAEGYTLDISSYAAKDTEWANIPTGIESAVHFKKGIYAIPSRLNMAGLFANMDIVGDVNKTIDDKTDFSGIVDIMTEVKKDPSKVALNYVDNLYEVLPSTVNPDYGYFTWDGSSYHLDSDAFKSAIGTAKNIYDSKMSFDSLSESDISKIGGGSLNSDSPLIDAWDKGHMAFRYGYTYEIPDMISKNPQFQIKFIGIPGGRTPIIGDYYCVYKNTKNPELAYKFAKWMSFGKEGMLKRFELYKSYDAGGNVCNTLPLTNDEEVLNTYFTEFPDNYESTDKDVVVEGVRNQFNTLNTGIVEGVKVIPNYNQSRWKINTGLSVTIPNPSDSTKPLVYDNCNIGQYLDGCVKGNGNINTYASALNEKANGAYTSWMTSYGANYQ